MQKSKKEKLDKEIRKEEAEELAELKQQEQERQSGTEGETAAPSMEMEQLRDQLLRKAAEFENYKRRTENEISGFLKYANEETISDLLPVLDDFDRVLSAWNDKHDVETFRKGVELIYDKFKKILGKKGLKEMDTDGKPFDVNLHDALLQAESDMVEPNTITETVEKGYYLKDKVLRHAKVIVSKKSEKNSGTTE